MEFDFGAWMRASDPPGRNNSGGQQRFRGEGSKSYNGNRVDNRKQGRRDDVWRPRKEPTAPGHLQNLGRGSPPSAPDSEAGGSNKFENGVFNSSIPVTMEAGVEQAGERSTQ